MWNNGTPPMEWINRFDFITLWIPIDGRVINDSAKSGGGWRRREREWGRED